MHKLIVILLSILLAAACSPKHYLAPGPVIIDDPVGQPVKEEPVEETSGYPEYSPSTLIISYDAEIGKETLLGAVKDYGAEIIYDYNIINAIAIKIPEGKTLQESIEYFRKVKGVLAVEKDRIYHLTRMDQKLNFPLPLRALSTGVMDSIVSQCSAIFPFSTRKRS